MSDDEFVRTLYLGLLGREPDPLGYAHHLGNLQTASANPERYAQMAAAFAASTEFAMRLERLRLGAGKNHFLPDLTGVRFENIVSIGSACHAAAALKSARIRKFSTPFDWIFSSPEMVRHCLEDDFASFLDQTHYLPVEVQARQSPEINLCHHQLFREKFGVQHVFNHHDPTQERDHAYFVRAVDRFRVLLRSADWKLLVLVSNAPYLVERLEALVAAFGDVTSNYIVLALSLEATGEAVDALDAFTAVRHAPSLLAIRMRVAQASTGLTFPVAADNARLDTLLKSFWSA